MGRVYHHHHHQSHLVPGKVLYLHLFLPSLVMIIKRSSIDDGSLSELMLPNIEHSSVVACNILMVVDKGAVWKLCVPFLSHTLSIIYS